MGTAHRPVDTYVDICDLCDEILEKTAGGQDVGSLTHGYLSHEVNIPKTKRVWFSWPPRSRSGRTTPEQVIAETAMSKQYDFHAECILKLLVDHIEAGEKFDRPKRWY